MEKIIQKKKIFLIATRRMIFFIDWINRLNLKKERKIYFLLKKKSVSMVYDHTYFILSSLSRNIIWNQEMARVINSPSFFHYHLSIIHFYPSVSFVIIKRWHWFRYFHFISILLQLLFILIILITYYLIIL